MDQKKATRNISQLRTQYELEEYTPERIAEFLLSNSVDAEDYAQAVAEVRRMGLNPENILHSRPSGV
jgi:hypothetical protein